jgi:AraC-like DNA-binding protein
MYHGHVKLRLGPIAAELGTEMRSLERSFVDEFGKTMLEHQTEARLEFSKVQLRLEPRPKLSVIANLLGYEDARGWARFFKQHVGESPSAWSRRVLDDTSL